MREPVGSSPNRRIRIMFGLFAIVLVVTAIPLTMFMLHLQHIQPKADITVDFGLRQNHSHPIHTQFGIAGTGKGAFFRVIDQASPYLASANLTLESYIAQMEDIFKDPNSLTNPAKPDWSAFDSVMIKIQATSWPNPLVTLQGTPPWLQPQNQTPPSPNYCLSDPNRQIYPFHAFPTHRTTKGDNGLALYSQLPALVVAHMDKYFPNIHPNYELWNEPDDDQHAWCDSRSDPHGDQTRFNWYKAIYITSAPLMEAQARADHVQIKIGGPTLAWYARVDTWLPKFLNDPQMAPYIDFVTYHQYAPGPNWKTVLSETQNLQAGYAAIYEKVARYVREGKQPNAQSTPIYIGEYNCGVYCHTSPIYAPLWNALLVADLLNTANDSHSQNTAPPALPAGLAYWTWNLRQNCLFGTLDAQLDCSTSQSPIQPYPPYYSYLLLGGKNYLDLTNGGYVANTATMDQKGLVVTDFYTNTRENVLVVNPSGQSYSQLTILVTNPGSVKTIASYYTLNQANPHIGSQTVDLSPTDKGYYVTVNVPAYSTVALSLDVTL